MSDCSLNLVEVCSSTPMGDEYKESDGSGNALNASRSDGEAVTVTVGRQQDEEEDTAAAVGDTLRGHGRRTGERCKRSQRSQRSHDEVERRNNRWFRVMVT